MATAKCYLIEADDGTITWHPVCTPGAHGPLHCICGGGKEPTSQTYKDLLEKYNKKKAGSAAEEEPNPKAAEGRKKPGMSAVPIPVLQEMGVGMAEGAFKYGRHNYRASPIVASDYYDAVTRHLQDWMEGVDLDPECPVSHLSKAMCALAVLRDAEIAGTMVDDRPLQINYAAHKAHLQEVWDFLNAKTTEIKEPFTQISVDGVGGKSE